MTGSTRQTVERVPRRLWVGLIAIVVYVALAGGLANLLDEWLQPADAAAEYALTHLPVLVPLIIAGVVFVRWAGWQPAVWRTPAAFETRPRRLWLLVIPALMLVNSVSLLVVAPYAGWTVPTIALVALVTGLVGLGEELYFRGILRASIIAHHGETVALLITVLAFGLAHSVASLSKGLPLGFVAFQIAVTGLGGVAYYAAFRATGRLWVPIALHALEDFSLQVSGGGLGAASNSDTNVTPLNTTIQAVLWGLALFVLISCIRQDVAARRSRRAEGEATATP